MMVLALFVALVLNASDSLAADPSLMRVMVVPSAGQLSLVLEMSDEARRVSMQQTSSTELVVEAGPIALPLQRQVLDAPSGLALLKRVAVDAAPADRNEHVLNLHVTLKQAAPTAVRVVGRRIYVDFSTVDVVTPTLTTPPPATASAGGAQKTARISGPSTPSGGPNPAAYREAINGAASRFEQIQPFLLSATTAASPNPAVLSAVADAIQGLQQNLRGLQAANGAGGSVQLLVSAVTTAAEAVSLDYRGDRASKAKESLAIFAAAKAQLQ